jgi:hypothetical protein
VAGAALAFGALIASTNAKDYKAQCRWLVLRRHKVE